eukprot:scaffold40087_cov34-Prasinocladus_malaysianus.AAC.1
MMCRIASVTTYRSSQRDKMRPIHRTQIADASHCRTSILYYVNSAARHLLAMLVSCSDIMHAEHVGLKLPSCAYNSELYTTLPDDNTLFDYDEAASLREVYLALYKACHYGCNVKQQQHQ